MSCTCDCHKLPCSELFEDVASRVGLLGKVLAERYPDFSDWSFSEPLLLFYVGIGLIVHAVGTCLHVLVRKGNSVYAQHFVKIPSNEEISDSSEHNAWPEETVTVDPTLVDVSKHEVQKVSAHNEAPMLPCDSEDSITKITDENARPATPVKLSPNDIIEYRVQQLQNSGRSHQLLLKAISRQDISTCEALLKSTHSNVPGNGGRWPIHEAALTGNEKFFGHIIGNISDVYVSCDEGKTALEYATQSGRIGCVRWVYTALRAGWGPTNWDIVKVLDRAITIAVDNDHKAIADFLSNEGHCLRRGRRDDEIRRKQKEFLETVSSNDTDAVKSLLDAGTSASSALSLAIRKRLSSMTELLLASTAAGHSYDWKAAMYTASEAGDTKMIQNLLPRIMDKSDRERAAYYALRFSMQNRYKNYSEELIRSGAISQKSIWKAATRYGSLEFVDSLIVTEYGKSIDKNCINKSFHWACSQVADKATSERSMALVRRFLSFKNGADVDNNDPVFGTTLQRAVASGDYDFIQLLIDHGEDVDGPGKLGGNSPLMVAVALGDVKAVRMLLDKGACLKSRGGIAGNLLQTASYLGYTDIVLELLNRGVDIDERLDPWGSPLMLALQGNHPVVADILITRGANVNFSPPEQGTALHYAAILGMEGITKRLVEAGANVNAAGGKYGTALQAAAARGHRMIALFLLDHGADVNIRGGTHGSVLEAAQAAGDPMLVRLLLLSGATAGTRSLFGTDFLPTSLPLEPPNHVLKKVGLIR